MIYLKSVLVLIIAFFLISLTANSAQRVRQPDSTVPDKTMRAYITERNGSGFTVCDIDGKTGGLDKCKRILSTSTVSPSAIVFNPVNALAYITSSEHDSIFVCSVNPSDGVFINCKEGGTTSFPKPFSIAFNASGTLAYVTSSKTKQIAVCAVSSSHTGMLVDCIATKSNVFPSNLQGSTFDDIHSRLYAVSDLNASVIVCDTKAGTKKLENCQIMHNDFLKDPQAITLNPEDNIAYIPQNTGGNSITLCNISSTGLFSSCKLDSNPTFDGPAFVSFNKGGTLAYISNELSNSVSVCQLSSSTGLFENCRKYNSNGVIINPSHISFHAS